MKTPIVILIAAALSAPVWGQQITLNPASLGPYNNPDPNIGPIQLGTVQASPVPAQGVTVTLATQTDFLWFTSDNTCNTSSLSKTTQLSVFAGSATPIFGCLINLPTGGTFFALISATAAGFPAASGATNVQSFPGGAVTASPFSVDISNNPTDVQVQNNSGVDLSKGQITFPPNIPTAWLVESETVPCAGLTPGGTCTVTLSSNAAAGGLAPNATYNAQVAFVAQGNVGAILVTYKVSAPVALRFIPIAPCRLVDTRYPNGPLGGPILTGGSSRDFVLPNTCGIPATAQAYALNVTVAPNAGLNFLTIWPTGQAQPFVSLLNSDGRIKANAAIVPAGTNGAVSVFATNDTHLVLDVSGYFVPAAVGSGLVFNTLTPCRVADTRNSPGSLGQPSLTGGAVREFPVLQSACNIPAAAQAYSMNFTVVPKTTLGFLSVWPSGQAQPYVSTLNDFTGTTVANAAIIPAGANGDISVFATDNTDLVIDVNGYFAPASGNGLSLYNLAPCRALDTRDSSGPPFSGSRQIGVAAGPCNVPITAQAYVINGTVVPSEALGFLSLWPDAEAQPYVSTLNAWDGALTSNMAIVPTSNGSIDAFASNTTHLILDVFGYFAP